MGMRMVRGRNVTEHEAAPSVVVNETFVRTASLARILWDGASGSAPDDAPGSPS